MVYLKKVAVVFHNVWNYNYLFIEKNLAKDFKRQFSCWEGIAKNT